MFSALAPADSRDSVSDKAASFQTERQCFWSGSSETRVNTNTHQHITDSITEKQSSRLAPRILLAVMLILLVLGLA